MLNQQCPYLGRDVRVAGASAGSALSVCAVCGTSGKSARKDDDEGQNVEWFTPSHLIHVRQDQSFQVGIDPTYADPRGRKYYGAIRYAFR
jgi:hypothetical protein